MYRLSHSWLAAVASRHSVLRLLTLHSLFVMRRGHECDPAAKELFFPILFDGFYESFDSNVHVQM